MAFMVPLVKNHYEIYNTRSAISDHSNDVGFYHSASSVGSQSRTTSSRRTPPNNLAIKNTTNNNTVVLNGIVLMNKSSKTKPKVILASQARNAGKQHGKQQKQQLQLKLQQNAKPQSKSIAVNKQQQQQQIQANQQAQSPNHMSSSNRSFPHVRRTVRNPVTNRVYSYSVSIPEYVAEEDEEELAALELEEELESPSSDSLDQVMIFSTSAPAGTGSIDNGIIDIVDEDDFIRCTGARLPTTIRSQSKQLIAKNQTSSQVNNSANTKKSNNNKKSKKNSQDALSIQTRTTLSLSKSLPNTSTSSSNSSSNNNSDDNDIDNDEQDNQSDCASSNSREYMELLQKFILHLKMLKLKRLFNPNKSKKQRNQQNNDIENQSDNDNNSDDNSNGHRSRSSTLDDSINL